MLALSQLCQKPPYMPPSPKKRMNPAERKCRDRIEVSAKCKIKLRPRSFAHYSHVQNDIHVHSPAGPARPGPVVPFQPGMTILEVLDMVEQILAGSPADEAGPAVMEHRSFDPQLVIRESTAAPGR